MHLNNLAGSSSNLSGADLLAVIAAALRLLTPPGSRSEVRRKADHEQAGIGEPPPSHDARRSFVGPAASILILNFKICLALLWRGTCFTRPA